MYSKIKEAYESEQTPDFYDSHGADVVRCQRSPLANYDFKGRKPGDDEPNW